VRKSTSVDVGRAFSLLDGLVRQNKIRKELQMQRSHERKGLRRKRLKGEQTRRRFMHGFRAAVERVKELRHQGW
jgi:hypothetical protein